MQDGKAAPKVIDFGIAGYRGTLTEKTVLTNFHAFIGTPAYTSPGTSADDRIGSGYSQRYLLAWSFLYELLTGVTPLDGKELTNSGIDGMRRMIQEVEPHPFNTAATHRR